MAPLEGSKKELEAKYVEYIAKFVTDIRIGKLEGSNNIAMGTVTLLEQIINDSRNATAYELCNVLREAGVWLGKALPNDVVPLNMVWRVLRAVRDEYRAHADQSDGGSESSADSLQRLVQAKSARRGTLGPSARTDLREPLRDHLAELRLELETSTSAICSTARSHVHAEELILSVGGELASKWVLAGFNARKCRVLLVEGGEGGVRKTHLAAARLAKAGVPVTLLPDAAGYGVMSRVNKVVVEVVALLAGGAALAAPGLRALTATAKHHSVPVLALAPLHKLTPLHAHDRSPFNLPATPHNALPYESVCQGDVHVYAPMYDVVPPDHITLFITNLGSHSPSYIYRLMSELYDPKDYEI